MSVFKPILGSVLKYEHKYICVKEHLLDDYIKENTTYLHSYKIEQKFYLGIKYRKYITSEGIIYVKHNIHSITKSNKSIDITEISLDEYNSIPSTYIIEKTRYSYRINNTDLILDIDRFNGGISLIEVWGLDGNQASKFKTFKGLVEVTGNKYYSNEYIASHQDNILSRGLYIIEGTDLIGKTTVVNQLIHNGYVCYDRDQYNFSNYILLDKGVDYGIKHIISNYKDKKNYKIYVLYTNNEAILSERIQSRKKLEGLSEFDSYCIDYNRLYISILKELVTKTEINIEGISIDNKDSNEIVRAIINGGCNARSIG